MPWCPKCDLEYKDGIEVCTDCGTTLVENNDSANLVNLVEAEDENFAKKLLNFLQYSDIKDAECVQADEEQKWLLRVPKEKQREAMKLYKAFYIQEMELLEHEKSQEQDDDESDDSSGSKQTETENPYGAAAPQPSNTFVKAQDRYNDFSSSAGTFIIVGILCLVVLILHITGTFSFLNGPIPLAVLGIMSIGLILLGLDSNKKAKELKNTITKENELTEAIKQWMKDNITENTLASMKDDSLSDEVNLMNQLDAIKHMAAEQFSNETLEDSFLEQLAEDFYYDNFN